MKISEDLATLFKAWIDAQNSDACTGCAFWERKEWEMPCAKCKRNCKDYWRPKKRGRLKQKTAEQSAVFLL